MTWWPCQQNVQRVGTYDLLPNLKKENIATIVFILTHLIHLYFISNVNFFSVESACQGGQEVGGNNCRRDQMCLPDGVGSYICLCGDGDKYCNGNR